MGGNREQIDYWNGEAGQRWAEQNALLDALIAPLGEATLDAAAAQPGATAFDIGCGCGNTTLALARRIGPGGSVTGVDVSQPMLAVARALAADNTAPRATLDFLCADAAEHAFPRGGADLLYSRFGVMFFADPPAAFANLRRALRPGGRVVFCCWRALAENELMRLPVQAVLAHMAPPEPPPPGAPGPFAFAEREHVRAILAAAGFPAVSIEPLDRPLHYGTGLPADKIATRLLEIGQASRLLADAAPGLRERVAATLLELIAPRVTDAGLVLQGCCWLVDARA